MSRRTLAACALAGAILVSCGACGKSGGAKAPAEKKATVAAKNVPSDKTPADKKAEEPAAAEVKKAKYVYDPKGKPDPFMPFLGMAADKPGTLVTPLEKFDLAQLKLKGVIWGLASSMAMVEDPDGKGYVVRVGTPIGKNMGRIIEIRQDKLVVLEQYVDPVRGSVVKKEVYMELPKGEGEL